MTPSKLKDIAISQIPFSIAKRAYSHLKEQESTVRGKLKVFSSVSLLDLSLCGQYILPIASHFIATTIHGGNYAETSIPLYTGAIVAITTIPFAIIRYGVFNALRHDQEDDNRDGNNDFEPEPQAPPLGDRATDFYWESRRRNRMHSPNPPSLQHTKT